MRDRTAKNIAILTGNALCHNPRVQKEALALSEAGYEVEVLGAWTNAFYKNRDRAILAAVPYKFTPVIDLEENAAIRTGRRIRTAFANKLHALAGVETSLQFGDAISALNRESFKRKFDFYIAHSEAANIVALNLRKAGRKVGVDMEDWYSEDLLPEARRYRPTKLLREVEAKLLHNGYATCTSHCMSRALAEEYSCPPPTAIYNSFSWSERQFLDRKLRDRHNADILSLHWFSQTLGPGRGLEDLMDALKLVDGPMEIHLRGTPAAQFKEWLHSKVPENWRERIFFHDLVPNDELLSCVWRPKNDHCAIGSPDPSLSYS